MNYAIGEVIEDFNTREKMEVIAFNKAKENGSVQMKLRNINTNEVKEFNGYIARVVEHSIEQ